MEENPSLPRRRADAVIAANGDQLHVEVHVSERNVIKVLVGLMVRRPNTFAHVLLSSCRINYAKKCKNGNIEVDRDKQLCMCSCSGMIIIIAKSSEIHSAINALLSLLMHHPYPHD